MQHLDDGVLHALVDGEVSSADLPPIRAHLEACAECAGRLEAARLLAGEADQLVDTIEFPGRDAPSAVRTIRPPGGGRLARRLAWAATVALAASLGYAGGRSSPRESAVPTDVAMVPTTGAPAAGQPASSEPPQVRPAPAPQAPRVSNGPTADQNRMVQPSSGIEPVQQAQPAARESEAPASRDRRPPQVVGGVNAPATAGRTAADEQTAESKLALRREATAPERPAAVSFEEVTLAEAVRRLGGTLRQVEGLVPVRLEAAGPLVRLVYRGSDGDLVLEQRRQGDSVVVRLVAPGLSPDSLARLRIRE